MSEHQQPARSEQDPFVAAERSIRQLPGVVGVAMFALGGQELSEIQVFTATGVAVDDTREQVMALLEEHRIAEAIERVYVFPLAQSLTEELGDVFEQAGAEPSGVLQSSAPPGDPSRTGSHPPGDGRMMIRRVILSTGRAQSEAQVRLRHRGGEHGGSAVGPTTAHSLDLTARATIDAIESVLGREGLLQVVGAALLDVFGRHAVCVVVSTSDDLSREFLGACLVGDAPVHEAAVRTTLDAVNRQLAASRLLSEYPIDQQP